MSREPQYFVCNSKRWLYNFLTHVPIHSWRSTEIANYLFDGVGSDIQDHCRRSLDFFFCKFNTWAIFSRNFLQSDAHGSAIWLGSMTQVCYKSLAFLDSAIWRKSVSKLIWFWSYSVINSMMYICYKRISSAPPNQRYGLKFGTSRLSSYSCLNTVNNENSVLQFLFIAKIHNY